MINEMERIRKEELMAWFKVLSWYLPRETKEKHEKPQDSWSPCQDLNPGPPEYKAGVLTTQL
jgi:hypothetical protein